MRIRKTVGVNISSLKPFEIIDDWTQSGNSHRRLDFSWVGKTTFQAVNDCIVNFDSTAEIRGTSAGQEVESEREIAVPRARLAGQLSSLASTPSIELRTNQPLTESVKSVPVGSCTRSCVCTCMYSVNEFRGQCDSTGIGIARQFCSLVSVVERSHAPTCTMATCNRGPQIRGRGRANGGAVSCMTRHMSRDPAIADRRLVNRPMHQFWSNREFWSRSDFDDGHARTHNTRSWGEFVRPRGSTKPHPLQTALYTVRSGNHRLSQFHPGTFGNQTGSTELDHYGNWPFWLKDNSSRCSRRKQ